jgi:hypothetical protein
MLAPQRDRPAQGQETRGFPPPLAGNWLFSEPIHILDLHRNLQSQR